MAPVLTERRVVRKSPRSPRPPQAWYGAGQSPVDLWPGVTIDFKAVWSTKQKRWQSDDGQYYFDAKSADKACDFFPEFLTHHIGHHAGHRFDLLGYQSKLLVRPLFGWKRAIDGLRRFRKVFAFIPKGAGKSPLGSGIGLYLLMCDDEQAAEVYAIASDRNQARIVHDNSKVMVEESPDLDAMLDVLKDSITYPDTRSTYQVLSADAASAHGKRPHGLIFDEFHAQPDRDLYEALKKSMPKRLQPVLLIITHAGDDDEGVCYEEYEYAKNVLSGTITDDTCLPIIFEAKPTDDWTSPDVWARVNPGHGVTIQHDGIAAECLEAQNEPRKKHDFLRYHLNRWVNDARAWVSIDAWDACNAPVPPIEELKTYPVAFGIDNAQKIDLASGVAVFRLPLALGKANESIEVKIEDEKGNVVKRRRSLNYRIAILPAFWMPGETLHERVKQDGIRFDIWRDQGFLFETDGAVIDADAIVSYIKHQGPHAANTPKVDLVSTYPLLKQAQFGYDPAFATEIALRLEALGLQTVEVLQNYKHLSEACQVFEALVKAKRVIHGGHPVLRWNVENVGVKEDDAGRIRPVKLRRRKRIDGVVATLIAISRLMVMPESKRTKGKAKVFTSGGWVPATTGDAHAPA